MTDFEMLKVYSHSILKSVELRTGGRGVGGRSAGEGAEVEGGGGQVAEAPGEAADDGAEDVAPRVRLQHQGLGHEELGVEQGVLAPEPRHRAEGVTLHVAHQADGAGVARSPALGWKGAHEGGGAAGGEEKGDINK
ncbi:hypothetical protein CEXT_381611 [Caerostris extrusa]|uniref:Uncharacterized protein n=1 Tax=Caerostris extrusa TaxID=172846 RepID=A0AAV4WDY4_CAEEX|nr:hypothetical protein CEXT_381611 [Caerostris extrusa]